MPAERTLLAEIAASADRPTLLIVAHRTEMLERCTRLLTLDRSRLVAPSTTAGNTGESLSSGSSSRAFTK